jgi:hypothetical protein
MTLNGGMVSIIMMSGTISLMLCWVLLCRMSLCRVLLCRMSLCWVLLCSPFNHPSVLRYNTQHIRLNYDTQIMYLLSCVTMLGAIILTVVKLLVVVLWVMLSLVVLNVLAQSVVVLTNFRTNVFAPSVSVFITLIFASSIQDFYINFFHQRNTSLIKINYYSNC